MIEQDIIDNLKQRYSNVHPLIFNRSVERAKDGGELFDILDSIPKTLPIMWDENIRRWVIVTDITQSDKFEI